METLLIGHPLLKQTAQEIDFPLDALIKQLITDMKVHLSASKGVGLVAPQVGYSVRLIIVASAPNERYPNAPLMEPVAMINPTIVSHSDAIEEDWEGCLSVPGLRAQVPRYCHLDLRYQTVAGEIKQQHFNGFIARIIQHEMDHLNGISFIERVQNKKSFMADEEYKTRVLGSI